MTTRAVDRRSVPDGQHGPGQVAQQMTQEVHDIGAAERALTDLQQQLPVHRQPTDNRQMIAGEQRVQHRGFAPGRIGADYARQGIEGRFVYPYNRPPLALGFA